MRMYDVEIGSPRFDNEFVIKASSPASAQALLTPEAQEAIFQLEAIPIELFNADRLHGSLHLQWGGGRLTITKPRSQWTDEALKAFVELSAELFVAALRPRPSGIEFVGEIKELDVATSQCQVCGEALSQDLVYCSGCRTAHHRECWEYFGGCSTYACGQKKYTRQNQV
jgi:Prokaryotic RING finger family 1